MIQARMIDPTGLNDRISVNPMAAIPHCYPLLVRKAILLGEQRIEQLETAPDQAWKEHAEEELGKVAVAMAKLVKIAADDATVTTFKEAAEKAGLAGLPYDSLAIFSIALLSVMNQVYFQTIREALHPGEKAIGIKELMEVVEERADATTKNT